MIHSTHLATMKDTEDFFRKSSDVTSPNFRILDEAEACAAVLMACRQADEINGLGGNK
jgi:hypothetical protein